VRYSHAFIQTGQNEIARIVCVITPDIPILDTCKHAVINGVESRQMVGHDELLGIKCPCSKCKKAKARKRLVICVAALVGAVLALIYTGHLSFGVVQASANPTFNAAKSMIDLWYGQVTGSFGTVSGIAQNNPVSENAQNIGKTISKLHEERIPVQQYNNCKTFFQTVPGVQNQTADTRCYQDYDVSMQIPTMIFNFAAPAEFVNSTSICTSEDSNGDFCKSKVYVYGRNDFKLALFDDEGEKDYKVKLYILPKHSS